MKSEVMLQSPVMMPTPGSGPSNNSGTQGSPTLMPTPGLLGHGQCLGSHTSNASSIVPNTTSQLAHIGQSGRHLSGKVGVGILHPSGSSGMADLSNPPSLMSTPQFQSSVLHAGEM